MSPRGTANIVSARRMPRAHGRAHLIRSGGWREWRENRYINHKSRAVARAAGAKLWLGAASPPPREPCTSAFTGQYALLQIGHEGSAKQLRDDSNAIKKLGFGAVYAYTGLRPYRRALRCVAGGERKQPRLSRGAANSRRPRRSPILPRWPWDRPQRRPRRCRARGRQTQRDFAPRWKNASQSYWVYASRSPGWPASAWTRKERETRRGR